MKTNITTLGVAALLASAAFAHEAVTIGPNGGRVLYVDSPTTPNVEVIVNKEGRAEIALLDKDRKLIKPEKQTVTVNAGPRGAAKKLNTEIKDGKFVTDKVPAGPPYFIVLQLHETEGAQAITLRLNYDPAPAASGKPAYLDDSVNDSSGDNIEVPDTAEGIWAELNQHQKEIEEAVPEKKYEAIDEITRAYPKLAKGLPAKAGDKQKEVSAAVDTLVKHLAAVHEAGAARNPDEAKKAANSVKQALEALKKLFPEKVANSQLKE
jgi:hypothetical protein